MVDADAMMETGGGVEESESSSMVDESAPATPPTKEDQLKTLEESIVARLEVDKTVFLVPMKWYVSFKTWAKGDTASEPGRVDPEGQLCDPDGVLSEMSVEGKDWWVVNEEGWNLIKKW